MGLKIQFGGSEIRGPKPGDPGPQAHFEDCVLGANFDIDLTWLRELPSLEKVTFKDIKFHDVMHGREDLWPMLAGRARVTLRTCRFCASLFPSEDGSLECPDELAHRCVLYA